MSTDTIDNAEQGLEIAVIGMDGRFPGADDLNEFWNLIENGVETVSVWSPEELEAHGADPERVRHPLFIGAHGALEGFDLFDAAFFGYNPREAQVLNPQYRIFLECAWNALEQAGYDPARYDGAAGVFAGSSANFYLEKNIERNLKVLDSVGFYQAALSNLKDTLATRVSYKLDLRGPAFAVQCACSTSLVAIHIACQSLINGECDMALAGGVSITVPQLRGYVYQEGMILSADGHCRAFDAGAVGTVLGDGVGVVVLKRLDDALRDRDRIDAVILGSAANNDGAQKIGFTAPGLEGQIQVIQEAQMIADVDPATLGYVEAHGTGTSMGDPIEMAALGAAYSTDEATTESCAVGSVKANIGHLDSAAGVASFIKAVLALKRRTLPPTVHFETPHPDIDFAAGPFFVPRQAQPWPAGDEPRRAAVSSFGMGGTNAHIILEEAPATTSEPSRAEQHLLPLSAPTESALDARCRQLADHIQGDPELNLPDLAYTLQIGRRAFPYRQTVVADGVTTALAGLRGEDGGLGVSRYRASENPPVVFLFPGQGAQYVGMGQGLYRQEPGFREDVDRCSALLEPDLGEDLRQLLYPVEGETEETRRRLRQTRIAQPALFVIEYSLARLWMARGIEPAAMVGHSIAEFVAACLAGVMSLEDSLSLVAARGRLMQDLPPGDMLAVTADEADLTPLLGSELSIAAFNAPGMCVVSGPAEAIATLGATLDESRVATRLLETSHAFHSAMMEPALAPFAEIVGRVTLAPPKIPFVSTVTGDWIQPEQATDPAHWVDNLRNPIRFSAAAEKLLEDADRLFLEVGPGTTLGSLTRITAGAGASRVVISSLRHPKDTGSDTSFLFSALGRLWTAGVDIDWSTLHADEQRRRVTLPTYPFERQRFWVEPVTEPRPTTGQMATGDDDKFLLPGWRATALPQPAELEGPGRYLLFLDSLGIGAELAQRLGGQGHETILVRPGERFRSLSPTEYEIDLASTDDHHRLMTELYSEDGGRLDIVHLAAIAAGAVTDFDSEALDRALVSSYYSPLLLARAIAVDNLEGPFRMTLVSNTIRPVLGDEVESPLTSVLTGVSRVVPQDVPSVRCSTVDLDLSGSQIDLGAAADRLFTEVTGQAADSAVAYRGRRRWVEDYRRVRLSTASGAARRIRTEGVFLITGGLGGLGLVLAEYLATTANARLVLTSRSALPERSTWPDLQAAAADSDPVTDKIAHVLHLESLGAEVLVVGADVADEEAMRRVVTTARSHFGPINGVIHAAGLQADSPVREWSPETSRPLMRAKIQGALTLDRVLDGEPLEFFVLMSSLASQFGGPNQVDYSAANAFLDAFAHFRSRRPDSGLTVSINWDAWKQVGMAARWVAEQGAEEQSAWLSPEDGTDALERILAQEEPQWIVTHGDVEGFRRRFIDSDETSAEASLGSSATGTVSRQQLSAKYAAPEGAVQQAIADLWQEMLGLESVGIDDDFFELGGHSLLATQVVARLNDRFGTDLTLSQVLEAPSVRQLADHVDTGISAGDELEEVEI